MLIKIYLSVLLLTGVAAWVCRRVAVNLAHDMFKFKSRRHQDFMSYWNTKEAYEKMDWIQAYLIIAFFAELLIGALGLLWILL